MLEPIGGLLVLVVVFGAIALVGHGIWVLVAHLIGGGERRAKGVVGCPFCARSTRETDDRCGWCGRELQNATADELRDLAAVDRQLLRWGRSGQISREAAEKLQARVNRYRERLLHPVLLPQAIQPVAAPPQVRVAATGARGSVEEPILAEVVVLETADAAAALSMAAEAPSPQPAQPARAAVTTPLPAAAPPVPAFVPPKAATTPPPSLASLDASVATPGPSPFPAPVAPPKPSPLHAPVAAARPAPLPAPVRAKEVAPPRSWNEIVAAFMEERNIRWGELIGGLLIVGPAIALVITFWEQLSANPYLQVSTFILTCSAVFGVGLYAHHRWKLRHTSEGLLVIATLLVPLCFLATGAVWKENWGPGALAAELVALGVFFWLTERAGRVLVPGGALYQATAVLGGSASILLAAHGLGPNSADWWYITAACVPVVFFGAATGAYVAGLNQRRLTSAEAAGTLRLLGTALFALLIALGMMTARSGDISATLGRLSMPLALAGLPILVSGLTVRRGVAHDAALAAWHVSGTAVAMIGMTAMLLAIGLAWPHPLAVIAVAAIDCAALAMAAFYLRMPSLHVGAILCATLAYLAGFHVIYSGVPLFHCDAATMFRSLVSGPSGTALTGLFVLFAVASEALARFGRHRHAIVYAAGAAAMALAGLMLTTVHGLEGGGDAIRAAVLCAIYGHGGIAVATRWRRTELTYFALALLAAAPLWALWADPRMHAMRPLWAAVLAGESLIMAVAAALPRGMTRPQLPELFRAPMLNTARAIAAIALVVGVGAAWFDRAAIARESSAALPVATVCLSASYLILAWQRRWPHGTWIGSLVAMLGLIHAAVWNYPGIVWQPWLTAMLIHSTLAAAAAMGLEQWTKRRGFAGVASDIRRVLIVPLEDTAELSSVLTLLVLPFVTWSSTLSLAGCLYWLAAIWLILAWRRESVLLFAGHQLALALATGVATAAWLKQQSWVRQLPGDYLHPYSLQAFGIALGVLSLLWIAVRISLRHSGRARRLLDTGWPAVDQILRHALVGVQLAVLMIFLLPTVIEELVQGFAIAASFRTTQQMMLGGGAWLLAGVLAANMLAALWQRWRSAELISSFLLVVTAVCLIAGRATGDIAAASALRWGLGFWYLAFAAALWGRSQLRQFCQERGMRVDLGRSGWMVAHGISFVTAALPVIALTILAAIVQLSGTAPGGPVPGSFFGRLGPSLSYLVPLVLIILAMVGHALRESSAGYAFSAGLVAQLGVNLGYSLSVVLAGTPFGQAELVTLLQLATITAAAWGLAWLAVRRHVNVLGGDSRSETAQAAVLMRVQLGMGVAGNVLLLGLALCAIVFPSTVGIAWTSAAGTPLGWLAMSGAVAAIAYRSAVMGRRLSPNAAGLMGMAAIGLLACTVCWVLSVWLPGANGAVWGYRTLMLGWAVYALFVVLATWWVASLRTLPDAHGPPQTLVRAAAVWVRLSGILAVLLGLKASLVGAALGFGFEEHIWAATAIAIASVACATMAVWRRQEGWAFSAALETNLAASLVVWYFHRGAADFSEWWLRLVEANVIASSTVALVWLAARRRLYQLRELRLASSPLLGVQVSLPALGMIAVLVVPVVWLACWPAYVPESLSRVAGLPGWLALAATAAAVAWYLRQIAPGALMHVAGGLIAGVGVLLACLIGRNDPAPGGWHAYHTLTIAWASGTLALVALGWVQRLAAASGWRLLPLPSGASEAPSAVSFRAIIPGWVTALGGASLLFATLHCAADTAGAWWPISSILLLSVAAALVALSWRLPAYVVGSGLLLNVAGVVGWLAWGPTTLAGLLQINIVCLAVGSLVWSLLGTVVPGDVPHLQPRGRPLIFAHEAAATAVALLTLLTGASVVSDLFPTSLLLFAVGPRDWLALGAVAVAVAVCLWDQRARFVLAGEYTVALCALAMFLCGLELTPREWAWWSALLLPAFALATAIVGWMLPHLKAVCVPLGIPNPPERWPRTWFCPVQTAWIAVSATLATWVSLDVAFDAMVANTAMLNGRLGGSLGALFLLAAAVLMAVQAHAPWRRMFQYVSFAAGVMLLSSLGWAQLDLTAGTPAGDAPWLHRCVVLLAAAVVGLLTVGVGLARALPAGGDWSASSRRAAPVLGGLALLTLAGVLVAEWIVFDPSQRAMRVAWMAPWAITVVATMTLGVAAACILCALVPAWDPLRLTDRQRTAYVYAAEALLGLLLLHLRITMPGIFLLGLISRYWMLLVLVVAFCGAGLSALFYRRGMTILSEPLERTALFLPLFPPLVALLVKNPAGAGTWLLGSSGPAFWLMMGAFYGVMAVRKRSLGLAALGILTGNIGLWVLWHRCGWGFVEHPQLWLIPPALAALVAEHLDRRRLNASQRSAIRYLALATIYISSTTEFWRNIGDSAVLPLVTIVLAVLGVLAGIFLRVRSFVYLGFTFLVVVIARMIVYAAFEQRHIWVFWISCIVLGAAILAMFAVFEKRRNDVLAAVERFRQWER
ncbi:MAG: hypothetical protein ACOY3P_17235 [Planctomycetota bacterium]